MLDEMASLGGRAVATDEATWASFAAQIVREIGREEQLFLLARDRGSRLAPSGLAHASVVSRDGVLEPARVLHIHALYVEPEHRRRGIGRALLQATLKWGSVAGCIEAELNVLLANPAQALYEGLGFRAFQTEMVRGL